MAISKPQLELITAVDTLVENLQAAGHSDESILIEMGLLNGEISDLINELDNKTFCLYCYEYDFFYYYVRLLEQIIK